MFADVIESLAGKVEKSAWSLGTRNRAVAQNSDALHLPLRLYNESMRAAWRTTDALDEFEVALSRSYGGELEAPWQRREAEAGDWQRHVAVHGMPCSRCAMQLRRIPTGEIAHRAYTHIECATVVR